LVELDKEISSSFENKIVLELLVQKISQELKNAQNSSS